MQVVATIDEELEVIEPGAELAELLAGVRAMTDETEHQLAVRLDAVRAGVDDPWDADARWVSEAHTRRG